MNIIRSICIAVAILLLTGAISRAATETELRGASGLSRLCVRAIVHSPTMEDLQFNGEDIRSAAFEMLREKLPGITILDSSAVCRDRVFITINILKNTGAKGTFLGTAGNITVALHRPVYLEDKSTRLLFAPLWQRSLLFLTSPDEDIFAYITGKIEKKIDEFAELVKASGQSDKK
jgi:hypothetical protein